jgi:hypothetical protein
VLIAWIVAAVVVVALLLWPVTPRTIGRFLRRLVADVRVLSRAKRNRMDFYRYALRRPQLVAAVGMYELSLLLENSVEPRVKYLASVKASSLTGCPF